MDYILVEGAAAPAVAVGKGKGIGAEVAVYVGYCAIVNQATAHIVAVSLIETVTPLHIGKQVFERQFNRDRRFGAAHIPVELFKAMVVVH